MKIKVVKLLGFKYKLFLKPSNGDWNTYYGDQGRSKQNSIFWVLN